MRYQLRRGGRIVYQDIAKPQKTEWASGLEAMETALKIEHEVNDSLLALHDVATKNNDGHFCDFLECESLHSPFLINGTLGLRNCFFPFCTAEYLEEQINSIKQLADYVTNLRRCGPGLGEYMFDKETLHGGDD